MDPIERKGMLIFYVVVGLLIGLVFLYAYLFYSTAGVWPLLLIAYLTGCLLCLRFVLAGHEQALYSLIGWIIIWILSGHQAVKRFSGEVWHSNHLYPNWEFPLFIGGIVILSVACLLLLLFYQAVSEYMYAKRYG